MAIGEARHQQIFPTLPPLQIGTARRFASGEPCRFGPGDILYDIGARDVPCWLILDGSADALRRGPSGRSSLITTYGPGQFTGETNQLSGRPTLMSVVAGGAGAVAVPLMRRISVRSSSDPRMWVRRSCAPSSCGASC